MRLIRYGNPGNERPGLLVVHAADLSGAAALDTATLENLGHPVAVVF